MVRIAALSCFVIGAIASACGSPSGAFPDARGGSDVDASSSTVDASSSTIDAVASTVDAVACDLGTHACGVVCVADTSVEGCGDACTPCPAPAHSAPTCDGVACGIDCDPGYLLDGDVCTPGPLLYLKASNTGAVDRFGYSVALSADGTTMAVGAPGEGSSAAGIDGDGLDDSVPNAGAVYVFVRTGDTWTQQAYVKASNPAADDAFGWSVALSADGATLAVGAYGEASNATGVDGDQANNALANAGAVYVFARVGATWSQQAYLKSSAPDTGDQFGISLSLSGDGATLAVGAYFEASNATGIDGNALDDSAAGAGAVYVFVRAGVAWSQQAYVKASNTGQGDLFGYRTGLSDDGNRLAVGAYGESSNATGIDGDQANDLAAAAGAVYVFDRVGATWSQTAYLKASNTDAQDAFGASIALAADGTTLAVAAIYEDSATVGVDGDQADDSAVDSGAAYVFTFDGASWSQQAYLKPAAVATDDLFGVSLALTADGATLVVGSPREDSAAQGLDGDQANDAASNAGAAYRFAYDGAQWRQGTYVKADNSESADFFGYGCAIGGPGPSMVVGALFESSAATGVGGDALDNTATYAGAVYVVELGP